MVDASIIYKISQEVNRKLDLVIELAEDKFENYRKEVERIHTLFIDSKTHFNANVRNSIIASEKSKLYTEHLAKFKFFEWKKNKLFSAWKENWAIAKDRKKKLSKIFFRLFTKVNKNRFNRWKDYNLKAKEAIHTQISTTAFQLTQDFQPKIKTQADQINKLAKEKADKAELEVLADMVMKKDLRVVFQDIKSIVNIQGVNLENV